MAYDSFTVSRDLRVLLGSVQLQSFSEAGRQDDSISQKPVAYSRRIGPLTVADYDCDGSVRGIEFLGRRSRLIETYLERAIKASRGPLNRATGGHPESGLIGLLLPAVQRA